MGFLANAIVPWLSLNMDVELVRCSPSSESRDLTYTASWVVSNYPIYSASQVLLVMDFCLLDF